MGFLTTHTVQFNVPGLLEYKPRRSKKGGFILPEVLVVVSLSVIALAIVTAAITAIMRHSISLSYHSTMNSQAKRTVNNFNEDVRTATTITTPTSTKFTLEIPDGVGGSDTVQYAYTSSDSTLRKTTDPALPGEVIRIMMDGVETFSFTYFTINNNSTTKPLEIKKK